MKASDFVAAFEHFFIDIVGTVIPGVSLILGCWILLDMPARLPTVQLLPPTDTSSWLLLIIAGYAIGHAVASLGAIIFVPSMVSLAVFLRRVHLGRLVPAVITTNDMLFKSIAESSAFREFVKEIQRTNPNLDVEKSGTARIPEWRNIAMTIAREERDTIYRFMFVSLLNAGVATVLCSIALLWLFLNLLNLTGVATFRIIPLNGWIVLALLIGSLPFFERRFDFYDRAMRTPFSMALATLITNQTPSSLDKSTGVSTEEKKQSQVRVYLAGGFRSGWQDRILSVTSRFSFSDPRIHGLADEAQYTLWDLEAIRRSDWIFAYMEETNPAGYALALEIGFAKALSKRILLVDERSSSDKETRRYMGMVRAAADMTFESFEDGLDYLKMLEKTM